MPDTDFTPALVEAAARRRDQQRMVDGYNLLRDALSWFDAHEAEKKLGHLPQWVVTARELFAKPR